MKWDISEAPEEVLRGITEGQVSASEELKTEAEKELLKRHPPTSCDDYPYDWD